MDSFPIHRSDRQLIDNRYQLKGLIGTGGMGRVYQAEDQQTGRPVAVKILSSSASADRNRLRFQREFRILTRLSHPHIITVYDYGQTSSGNAYLVMELLQGMDLNRWRATQQDELDFSPIYTLVSQICQALAYIHNQGIIHRDIKPSNIMITNGEPPLVKLMDFGLARPQKDDSQVTKEGMVLGTITYMAPELVQGKTADRRADLYSLGIVLYELLAGQRPFSTRDMMTMALQHLTAKPRPLASLVPNLPANWDQIIQRLLEKLPADRYQSAEDVLEAFGTSAGTVPTARFAQHADLIFEAPFVGRVEALAQAENWLQPNASLLLIQGEAGVGKSRFLDRLGELGQEKGWEPLSGHLHEGGQLSYQPIVEILRQLRRRYDFVPTLTWQPLLPLLPELSEFPAAQQWDPLTELGAEADRLRLYSAINQILAEQAKRRPLLLLVDDLQWVDEGTAALIAYLVHHTSKQPFVIAGAYRPEEAPANPALTQLIHGVQHEHRLDTILLDPLNPAEAENMVNAMLGLTEPMPGLGQRLFRETEGNPFFVKEIIKYWVETGTLQREAGQWVKFKTAPLSVPTTVRDLILRRLSQLDDSAQSALRAAAVIGTTFPFDLWLSVCPLDEDLLLDTLDHLIRARLIEERTASGEDLLAFTHHKIQTVIYQELTSQRRSRLHRQVAEQLQASSHSDPTELAHHYLAAEEWELALAYTRQAIHEANAQYDALRALALCRQALTIFDHLPMARWAHEKAALLHDTAERLFYLGRFEEAVEIAMQAVDLTKTHKLASAEAQALVDLTRFAKLAGRVELVKPALERAESLVQNQEQSSIRAQILQAWGRSWYQHTRDYDKVITVMLQAANIYRQLGDSRGTANCLREAANARYLLNELSASIPLHLESLTIQRREDDRLGVAVGLKDLGLVYRGLGRHAEAEQTLREAVGLTQGMGLFWVQTDSATALAQTLMALNRWDEAAAFFQVALDVARKLGRPATIAEVLCQLGSFDRWLGQRARSRSYYEEAQEIGEAIGAESIIACSGYGLLTLALQENRPAEAARHGDRINKLNRPALPPHAQLRVAAGLARLLVAQGRPAEALIITDSALSLAESVEEWEEAMDFLEARAGALASLAEPEKAIAIWSYILAQAEARVCTYRQWYARLALSRLTSDPAQAAEHRTYARILLEQSAKGISNPDERAIFWSSYR